MFKFSLEALHRVRKRKEEEKQKELAHVMNALMQEKGSLERYRTDIAEKLVEQGEMNRTHYDNNLAILYDEFICGRKFDVEEKNELIERINEVAAEKRKDVLKAYIDRKVIDNFKKKEFEQYADAEKKAEQRELDEIVTMGFKKFREHAQRFGIILLCLSVFTLPACGNIMEPAKVDDMNKKHEEAKAKAAVKEEETLEQLREAVRKQSLQNQQILIEMANLKEKMIELENTQPSQKPEIIEVVKEDPLTHQKTVESRQLHQPNVLYKMAYNAYKAKNYAEARNLFEQFIADYPRDELADNCLYWLGETYYDEKDYKTALHHFQRVQNEYPQGNKVPDAMLKIAHCYYFLGRKDVALKAINDFNRDYPQTTLRSVADKLMDKIQAM